MTDPAAGAWAARVWGLTDTLAGTRVALALGAIADWTALLAVMVSRQERGELLAIAWGVLAPRRAVAR